MSAKLNAELAPLAERITDAIFGAPEQRRRNAEFAKLELHDGRWKITRWGDIAKLSRTPACGDYNIRTWANRLFSREEILAQVSDALSTAQKSGLDFGPDTFGG